MEKVSTTAWPRRQASLFDGLSRDEVARLAALVETRVCRAGDPITGPDAETDRLYVVERGIVRLFHRGSGGREITADLIGPGRLFGVAALGGESRYWLLAEALTNAVVWTAHVENFQRAMAGQPTLTLNLVAQLSQLLLDLDQQLQFVGSADARTRLAGVLHRLASEAGERAPRGGRRIRVALTHAVLARQIGSSRETVTRMLASLERQGQLRREGRQLIVIDPERLALDFRLPDRS